MVLESIVITRNWLKICRKCGHFFDLNGFSWCYDYQNNTMSNCMLNGYASYWNLLFRKSNKKHETQLKFSCSNSAIETLEKGEKGMKYIQSY